MKRKIVGLLGAALITSSLAISSALAAETPRDDMKLAVVNVQQILQQSSRVSDLSKKLENRFKPRQQKLNEEQAKLQSKIEQFKKESPTMAASDKDALQKKIDGDRNSLVKQVVAYQQELNKEQNKVMQELLGDVNSIVAEIANKNNYSMVLDSQALVYAPSTVDITKQVSEKFNNKKN